MKIKQILKNTIREYFKEIADTELNEDQIQLQETRKDFEGEVTLVVFPLVKLMKKSPEDAGKILGEYCKENVELVKTFNVVKGFLNFSIADKYWLSQLKLIAEDDGFGDFAPNGKKVVLEYCGPNTNKPLHFGHLKNMCLGFATANILSAAGFQVHKVNIYNDRGIAICKSMLGWQKYFDGATPQSSGKKGDFLVAEAYVKFEQEMRKEAEPFIEKGMDKNKAYLETDLMKEARKMLIDWENGAEETIELWQKMNNWVYEGFNQTYDRLGVDFEKNYYESDTYKLGKKFVEQGLDNGIFFKKEDNSVWVNLEDKGLDEKLLLRGDGTSVYLTQDLGTADERSKDYNIGENDELIYVVGDPQIYHFKVLKLTLEKMGKPYANGIYHLAYGMIGLPGGAKMKTREGTSVDADDLMDEVVAKAKALTLELGKLDGMTEDEQETLFEQIGLAAIKYFVLKVTPKKSTVFDPEQSIALQGDTGPFIQYTNTRIKSLLKESAFNTNYTIDSLEQEERNLIVLLLKFPKVIQLAAKNYDPSEVAAYCYELAKSFNKFYAEHSILNTTEELKNFRLSLSSSTSKILTKAMNLLGINMPERM